MRLGRHGDGDGVDLAEHLGRVRERRRVHEAANLPRARFVDVDDADEVDAGQRRKNPRVMLPERADADHSDTCVHVFYVFTAETQRRRASFRKRILCVLRLCGEITNVFSRPTIAMPASSALLISSSRSNISVFPASIDSADAPAVAHRLHGRQADDRHVETHVLLRLRHLDDAHAGTGELPGARDHFVGAFHRLDRNHGAMLHGDRLADVEPGNRVGHLVSEREVLLLFVRTARASS